MKLTILAIIMISVMAGAASAVNTNYASQFIKSRQLADGSFDAFSSPQSAPAILALYFHEGNSSNVSAGIEWLKTDLQSDTSYSWSEADIPGLNLYAYSLVANLSDINKTEISQRLLDLRGEDGGFKGYSQCIQNCSDPDWTKQVWAAGEDAVSTSAALMGLIASDAINESDKNRSINYLLQLRNPDGSYNLTNSTIIGNFWALGPDIYSQTAFVILGLKTAQVDEIITTSSLEFLRSAASIKFNDTNRTFAASITSLVFSAYNDSNYSKLSLENLKCAQNPDGGFRDPSRFGESSNVLDTAFAMLAINSSTLDSNCTIEIEPTPTPSPSPTACVESWSCTDWSACSSGSQTRTCTDANSCGTAAAKPSETQTCSTGSVYTGNYIPPTPSPLPTHSPSPLPSPKPSPSPTPTPSPIAIDIQTETPSPIPSATVKNQEPKKDSEAVKTDIQAAPGRASGLFTFNDNRWIVGSAVLLIAGVASYYLFMRRETK